MKAPRNRTLSLTNADKKRLSKHFAEIKGKLKSTQKIVDKILNVDFFKVAKYFPTNFVDLLFIDPPYNLSKNFNSTSFRQQKHDEYEKWVDSWLTLMIPMLKDTASVYICGDWRSSGVLQRLCEKYFVVRNRITFEREKGRGSKKNWKNNSEDIWFCTMSDDFVFNSDAVKLKRRVVAPYRENQKPKDWKQTDEGNFRLTYPSNLWTDISIPFWSMPENTPHPTQKPEKLLAKIILASSNPGDFVLDPFAGVGTTGVVANKLGRKFTMVEIDKEYSLYAQKRLELASESLLIQGYRDSVFWERNTHSMQNSPKQNKNSD